MIFNDYDGKTSTGDVNGWQTIKQTMLLPVDCKTFCTEMQDTSTWDVTFYFFKFWLFFHKMQNFTSTNAIYLFCSSFKLPTQHMEFDSVKYSYLQ